MPPGNARMRLLGVFCLLLPYLVATCAEAGEESFYEVQVAEPFLELHTGPGRGYPVFYVVDRGEQISVLKRRTDWFSVRTAKGKVGWARRADMELTLTPAGKPTQFAEPDFGDYSRRRWEAGLLAGDFGGANIITAYAAYAMTANLAGELSVSQVFGDYSDALIADARLIAQPFPEWRLSPYFSLGTGIIYTDPNVTLVDEQDRTEQIGSVGAGFRWYLTRRFLLRAEYRYDVIFQDTNDNQEINEWKAGFSFFF